MFYKSSILKRLTILGTIIILALLANGAVNFWAFQQASKGFEQLYRGGVSEILQLSTIKNLFQINVLDTVHKVRNGLISWEEAENNIQEALSQIDSTWNTYMELIHEEYQFKEVSPILNAQNERLEHEIKEAKPVVIEQFLDIIKRQDKEALPTFIPQFLYRFTDPIKADIDRLIAWHTEDTINDYKRAAAAVETAKMWNFLVFSLALLLIIGSFIFIAKSITKPLKMAIKAIKKVALGDLTTKIKYQSNSESEVHQLLEAVHHMTVADKKFAHALSTLANGDLNIAVQPRSNQDILGIALANMADKLRLMIGSIREDIVSLADSSREIVDTVSKVAVSSSETATAVSETTTTVEELKQTAQISTEKANDVLTSAEQTLRVVQESEKSLKSTLEDMGQINEKMRIISEGIIKLSEFTQTIGEIIDTVNDLAEQSNLLAVNAAIEAAKAGEQGKGFGVVAQEIRTLAEQSKNATIQIRGILSDIQNATNAAVLATEQGTKAVEKGMSRSSQTNESMRALVTSMGYVTQAANQIVLSSQQQLVGVDQVNLAMNNINDAAKQHIDNMKTIENTVIAFNSIGQTLKGITDQYILTDSKKRKMQFDIPEEKFLSPHLKSENWLSSQRNEE
jgi:methyl-accepting chemotaxis protein